MAGNIAGGPKRRKRAAATSLPDEIVNEILLLLPGRSVLRFRAVCRQWAAHLSSPAFTEAYAAKQSESSRRTSKIVVFSPSAAGGGRRSTTAYSCNLQAGGPRAAADPLFTMDHVRTDLLSVSSWPSGGLVLFSDSGTRAAARDYWVCNPSTGECRALPRRRHLGLIASSAGLVLDHGSKEYKVVHLFFEMAPTTGFDSAGCEVCTLGDDAAGRRWRPGLQPLKVSTRSIMIAFQSEDTVTKMAPVAAGGFLHWLIYPCSSSRGGVQSRDNGILRFSAADEGFDFIRAPPPVDMGEDGDVWLDDEHLPAVPFHLARLQDSLCMVHDLRRRRRDGSGFIDVWVLGGGCNDVREWSLDYRIAVTPLLARGMHSPRLITVLGCCSGGSNKEEAKRLLLATSDHKVFAYTPGSGADVETVFSVEETGGVGLQKEAAAGLWLGMYEDSLVRIGGENRREKEVSSAVREVLLRLPLKSIARSMLVCWEWCTLIGSESFVAAHMSVERPASILMVTNGRARRAFFAFAPLESWLDQAAAGSAALAAGCLVDGGKMIICSKPCHGLNLISTSSDDYLCNPCTGAIQCLGIRGRSRFRPRRQPCRRHAFSVGRNIGFGFDRSTGEHVAVEIGHLGAGGALACMVPTSQRVIVVVAFDIATRAFGLLASEQRLLKKDDAFLVELNKRLSLVVVDRDAEEVEIWTMMMHERGGAWVDPRRIRLKGHPDFSPRTATTVVPLETSYEDGRILLNTGRALGYYDTKTGAIQTVYSLNRLQLPPRNLAFPMLCQESLVRVHDDMDLPVVASPPASDHNGRNCCEHPEHASADDGESGTPRPIFHKCQSSSGGCQGHGEAEIYSRCCKRVICRTCIRRCPEHSYHRDHVPLNNLYGWVIEGIQRHGLPMEHPSVPDPDYYCYYYWAIDADDVARHVFVSIKDFAFAREMFGACHLTECGYRMDGHGAVTETWARRYLKIDSGREPSP
ncbi:unnamed protein product [Urochloa decumbens]|uniref:F-box domain-containing protein n=1 Tax=Urochloa decumbens TaxID=240449 RepID=A0ABC9BRJ8_9POAL